MEVVAVANENNNEEEIIEQPKSRRRKSIVWEHFTVESVSGRTRARCNRCKQTFAYSNGAKASGTSHLKRHIARASCPVLRRRDKSESSAITALPFPVPARSPTTDRSKRQNTGVPVFTNVPFDQNRCREEIAEMIILHEYPLHMVEHSAFVSFVRNLQPQFNMVDFDTTQRDCIARYMREKQDLAKVIAQIPGRISLSVDLIISSQTIGYVVLTGYFIDSNWKFQRRVLNVVMVPSPYSRDALNHAVGVCLGDWDLISKIFTITIDKEIWEGSETGSLRGFFSIKNPLILNNQLLVESCYAHVLSMMAQDGFEAIHEIINKIRESIKYIKTSQVREEKFLELKTQLQVPSMKILFLDDRSQWNTTYHMLVTALELQEVFCCFDTADAEYNLALSMDEWKQIQTLCMYLKLLYDAANMLLDITCSTPNNYFHEVWKIQFEMNLASTSDDNNLIHKMKERSDKYWNDCSLVLALAVVMDPRFKMKLVEFSFTKIYGENASFYVKVVDEGIRELFSEYVVQPLLLTAAYTEVGNSDNMDIIKPEPTDEVLSPKGTTVLSTTDRLLDFDVFISECSSNQQTKSELDQYLEESLLPRVQDFDILSWWKLNELKYPVLSKMARDILSIPVSTATPDCVFKTEGNKLGHYRSSLQPETVEALICAKDWLRHSLDLSNSFVKMEL